MGYNLFSTSVLFNVPLVGPDKSNKHTSFWVESGAVTTLLKILPSAIFLQPIPRR